MQACKVRKVGVAVIGRKQFTIKFYKLQLFDTGKQGKKGYILRKVFFTQLTKPEAAERNRILKRRLAEIEQDPIGSTVSWKSIRRTKG